MEGLEVGLVSRQGPNAHRRGAFSENTCAPVDGCSGSWGHEPVREMDVSIRVDMNPCGVTGQETCA